MLKTNNKKLAKPKPHKQYNIPPRVFEDYDKELPIKEALGSSRGAKKKQEVTEIKSKNFILGKSGYRLGSQDSSFPLIIHGTAAPTSTPAKRGDIFIDTNNKKVYISTGVSSSVDWTILN